MRPRPGKMFDSNLNHTMKKRRLLAAILLAALCLPAAAQSETECLAFLYRSMPTPDSVDYPRAYWRRQVRMALKARAEMPWGQRVPMWEFENFVLPVRVNNESLDDARTVIYKELVPRLKGLSMEQAALEVNHWCHEKVSYRPSDGRTSAPLATMRNSIGRCGEESTFTVSALRAVGIPARQVYCPRWAHTDDNHAWVEVWVDGRWRFMGACEPEAVLDKGWFNWAASRAMLVRTFDYAGHEIPTTATYAPTKTLHVKVVDEAGAPIPDATVDFRLYNYSEFYPLHTATTDAEGRASFTTGYGDLQVWVSTPGAYGVRKADAYTTEMTLTPCHKTGSGWTMEYDWHVPVSTLEEPDRSVVDTVSDNGRRLQAEDKIRTDYQQAAFYHGDNEVLRKARSNWRVLAQFLKEKHPQADLVLQGLSEKDLRDVTLDVLRDACLMSDVALRSGGVRVSTEPLRPYVAYLQRRLPKMTASQWTDWVERNVRVDNTNNPKQLCLSVAGVYDTRRSDAHSRELFTVAGARALGLRAELDPLGKARVADGDRWLGLKDTAAASQLPQGTLKLDVAPDVMYYHGYTISRMVDGRPQSLDYADDDPTVTEKFRKGLQLPAGDYLLTTGTRLKGGDVLTRSMMFSLKPGQVTQVPVCFRSSERSVKSDLQLDDSEKNARATSVQSAQ